MDSKTTSLSDVIKITYITAENSSFEEKDGFISMLFKREDGEEIKYDRVFLHRVFPHGFEYKYISVLDRDNNEIGMISDISVFSGPQKDMLMRELSRKYRVFIIKKILSVNEKYGYSYWRVEDQDGEREFTVSDTYRSITKITPDRITVTDVDGNRYEISSLSGLDRKSYRKIELFL